MAERVFVRRKHELAQLNGFLDRALGGQGQISFVTGAAGCGKTALVTEFVHRAQDAHEDLLVAVGTCNGQTGVGDPYLPFREVLGLLTGDLEAQLRQDTISDENARRLRAALVHSMQVVIELGPDLVGLLIPGGRLAALVGKTFAKRAGWMDRLEELVRRKEKPASDTGHSLEQGRVFEQYGKVLIGLASQRPLLIVLDDVQWIDAASAGLLFHLGRRIQDSPILIVGTYRPADVAFGRDGGRHPLEDVANEFKRYYGDVWVDLDQTSEEERRRLLDALLDLEPNRLSEGFRQALYAHTAGHPLFTIELLRDMQERGDLIRNEEDEWVEGAVIEWDDLPVRVEGVIEQRIGRLEERLRRILTVASVEGEDFTAQVVARVQAAEERELVELLSGELQRRHRLVQAQGIRRLESQRLSLYRFWHRLFQTYLYNQLDDVERSYLHEDVGRALETLYGDRTDEVAVQLAWQFHEAGIGDKAMEYLQVAGERAAALYAPYEAVEHFTHALELADQLSIAPPLDLYRARGQAYETLGKFDLAYDDQTAALRRAQEVDDPHGEWQALLDLGGLWTSRDYTQTGEYYRRALEQARALGEPSTVGHSLNYLGNWHVNTEEPREALQHHEEALTIFRRLGDQRAVARTLDLLGMATALGGDIAQSTAYYQQAMTLFRELNDRRRVATCLVSRMIGWEYLSETMEPGPMSSAQCVRDGEMALKITREINWRPGEAFTLMSLGSCMGRQGSYGRAFDHARMALDVAEDIKHHQWMAGAHFALGALYLDLLALPMACQHLEQALTLAGEVGSTFWIRSVAGFLASTYIRQHEPAAAENVLSAVLDPDTPFQTIGQRLAWSARGELALAGADPSLALQIADRLMASAVRTSPDRVIPHLARLRGRALAALGQNEEALGELISAREMARMQGSRPLLWRILLTLRDLYRATDRSEEAEREFLAARTIIEDLAKNIPDMILRNDFLRRASEA